MAELCLRKGDYSPDGLGGFSTAEGSEALLERILFKLSAHRGAFPLMPQLGSRLYMLPRHKPGVRSLMAERYVAEALQDEDGVTISEVEFSDLGDGTGTVMVTLEAEGLTFTTSLEV